MSGTVLEVNLVCTFIPPNELVEQGYYSQFIAEEINPQV